MSITILTINREEVQEAIDELDIDLTLKPGDLSIIAGLISGNDDFREMFEICLDSVIEELARRRAL